jgi:hypothetical protein
MLSIDPKNNIIRNTEMKKNLSSSRISHSSISSAISRDSKDKKNKNISLDLKETKKTIGD